jgi:hypothetical protein
MSLSEEESKNIKMTNSTPPDIILMCLKDDVLHKLCDLFPATKENMLRRAMYRRRKFMA